MVKVLLINPSYQASYGGAKASIVNPVMPTLGLATIAAVARDAGHDVSIYDMSFKPYDGTEVQRQVMALKPDVVGITATTPLMNQVRDMSVIIREVLPECCIVLGGAHPSAMPEETLGETCADIVCVGEADYTFSEICDGLPPSEIPGIWYRKGNNAVSTGFRPLIDNLDSLPMPAWDLYDLDDYMGMSRLLCRTPPVTMAEFSRGCVFKCDFCASKITMAQGYRKKSPERCADEYEYLYKLGFREFMLADDIFTSDQAWAVAVCDAIARRRQNGINVYWSCTNGIRVESADDRLFQSMRAAGCYRVSFGFESGNDEVLKLFGKGGKASVEQGQRAVSMARKAGIDTSGFFLLGLSPDSQDTMHDTIEYARALPLDMMKFGIAIAFPGTKMFENYAKSGLIRSYNWDDYFIYSEKPLFAHATLNFKMIMDTMKIAYRRAILFNPGFILRRFIRGIRTGEFFWDVYYAIKFFMMPATSDTQKSTYLAKDRWPEWDFEKNPPQEVKWQIVKKKKSEKIPG